jgi:hypothetical protein
MPRFGFVACAEHRREAGPEGVVPDANHVQLGGAFCAGA